MFKDNYATVFYFRLVKNLGKPCAEVRLQAHTAGDLRVFCSFILMKSCMADAIINFTGNKYINHNRDEKDFSTFTEKEDQQARLP